MVSRRSLRKYSASHAVPWNGCCRSRLSSVDRVSSVELLSTNMISVMARRPWSFKEDRRLMELAKSSTSLEEAAKLLGRSPDAIKRMALRLGLSLKSKGPKKG